MSSILIIKSPIISLPPTGGDYVRIFADDNDSQLKYVDSSNIIRTLNNTPGFLAPVRLATTAALPASNYVSGVLTSVSNGLLSVDGIAVNLGNSILVRSQVNAVINGVYKVTSPGSVGSPWILTRRLDMVETLIMDSGTIVSTGSEGTINGKSLFLLSTVSPITIGVSNNNWSPIQGSGGGSVVINSKADIGLSVIGTATVGGPISKFGNIQISITATPYANSLIMVAVNGMITTSIGNGVKTADFYFSHDNGTTARLQSAITASDTLHVGSALSYTISSPDILDILYQVGL